MRDNDETDGRPTWRVVEIVIASVLGVACGALFIIWNLAWPAVEALFGWYPPASAIVQGAWLIAGVLGGLVIRKPGAALYVELVAATVSAFAGSAWGMGVIWYGLAQGVGAEAVFALLRYRRFGRPTALAAGAAAGAVLGVLNVLVYYAPWSVTYQVVHVIGCIISGTVLAGWGGWLLVGRLERSGALAPLGRGAAERV